jgi:PadR family transcriptional regulator, regulatory protein PadR
MKAVGREILLGFWKAHILHHAEEGALHGQWMLTELHEHGYAVSPGTLYPLLQRMERMGWLKSRVDPRGGRRARRDYKLTAQGREVLAMVREQIKELYEEVVLESHHEKGPSGKKNSSPSPRKTVHD